MSIGERWRDYNPSKATLFWACACAVVLTLIIGFTWGGWVTGGTAAQMAEEASEEARAELVATVCVERFLNAEGARTKLTSLKETSSWQRDDFIEKGGWMKLAGLEEPVSGAADLCADRLAEMELPTDSTEIGATVQ